MRLVDILVDPQAVNPEQRVMFLETLDALPEDSKEILRMIFRNPHKYLCSTPTHSIQRIRKYVDYKFGWGKDRIMKGIKDIRNILNGAQQYEYDTT